ncbi:MAG: methylated-DNA--[protein]-cysteine S-methyltransferase [Desulfobacterota bacterium]|nr:methylated-DNA--[protein]-cysteine S-methyltransferase [Thermodesulfobacteriota bacterium]
MQYAMLRTPYGIFGLIGNGHGLRRIFLPEPSFEDLQRRILATYPEARRCDAAFADVCAVLEAYFAGSNTTFAVPLDLSETHDFYRRVWTATAAIPYGMVQSYGSIARSIGSPGAARAVGIALANNPFPIIIPCHRVIRSDGGLGGFSAACGIALKQRLLEHEHNCRMRGIMTRIRIKELRCSNR